jgi:hypothetical protein
LRSPRWILSAEQRTETRSVSPKRMGTSM